MAVTAFWYGRGLRKVVSGIGTGAPVAWTTDTIKVALVTDADAPDQDVDEFYSNITGEVAAGGNYATGGETLAAKTETYDPATNRVILDNTADTVWTNSSITARYAVIYKDTGSAATSPLLGYVDFGQNETSSAANFTITWSNDGILRVTAA